MSNKNNNYQNKKNFNLGSKTNLNFYKTNTKLSNLRKSKVFIKSRFSRNRQWCRPIVFWSIWMNCLFAGYASAVFYGFQFHVGYVSYIIPTVLLFISIGPLLSNRGK